MGRNRVEYAWMQKPKRQHRLTSTLKVLPCYVHLHSMQSSSDSSYYPALWPLNLCRPYPAHLSRPPPAPPTQRPLRTTTSHSQSLSPSFTTTTTMTTTPRHVPPTTQPDDNDDDNDSDLLTHLKTESARQKATKAVQSAAKTVPRVSVRHDFPPETTADRADL